MSISCEYTTEESNENLKSVKIKTLQCAAVGTASDQHELEACSVYGDPTVCSCRHSKLSA
jgi:hypothetical protein